MIKYVIIYYFMPALVTGILFTVYFIVNKFTNYSVFLINNFSDIKDKFLRKDSNGKYNIDILGFLRYKGRELDTEDKYLWPEIKGVFLIIFYIINLPVFLLQVIFDIKYGDKFLWKLPASLYEVWNFGFLVLSFVATREGYFSLAIFLAICPIVSSFGWLGTSYIISSGEIRSIDILDRKPRIRMIIDTILAIAASFASIYYMLSYKDSNSFNIVLDIFDSIYFSVLALSTASYGDIIPLSKMAKFLTMAEVFLGYLYIILFIGVFLSYYADKRFARNAKKK